MEINEVPQIDDFNFSQNNDEVVHIRDAVDLKKQHAERYSCGFDYFNASMNGGFKAGDLVIISGRSGQGKTTFAQTLTYNFCDLGVACLWFSYEVSLEALNVKFDSMGMSDFYNAYTPKNNTSGRLDWVKAKIKEGVLKFNTKIVIIDHVDFLVPMTIKTSDNQQIELKKIATELKSLAIELDVIIITMAHLKKLDSNKEPEMEDIGYSAGIFQLADYVIFVMREKNNQYKSFDSDITQQSGDTYTNNSIIKYVKNRESGKLPFIKCQLHEQRFIEEPYISSYN